MNDIFQSINDCLKIFLSKLLSCIIKKDENKGEKKNENENSLLMKGITRTNPIKIYIYNY